MSAPEVVVFDLGKVLVDFDFSVAAHKIAARGSMPAEQVRAVIQESSALVRFESGQTTKEEFFAEVRQLTGFRGSLAEFAAFFADIFTPMHEMIALHGRLRERRVPTYIFSNTNELAVSHIRRSFPFFSHFDGYIYSYEVGAMKPHPPIYEALERLAGRTGPAIVYLDDRLENVQAGAARGWRIIHHRAWSETITAMEALWLV
jgi:HAD superfamily hydrolase (TIGR01509 family)